MTPTQDEIMEAVQAFITAETWADSKQIVETNRDVLLTDAADEVLASLLEQYKDDENATRQLEEHRRLLLRCRDEGIEAAFADRLGPPGEARRSDLVHNQATSWGMDRCS